MPCVGFELTIPASERTKTVHALDRSATVTGSLEIYRLKYFYIFLSFPVSATCLSRQMFIGFSLV
jgi:hypothetical protein